MRETVYGLTILAVLALSLAAHAERPNCQATLQRKAAPEKRAVITLSEHLEYLKKARDLHNQWNLLFPEMPFETYFDLFAEVTYFTVFGEGVSQYRLEDLWRLPEFDSERLPYHKKVFKEGWLTAHFTATNQHRIIATERTMDLILKLAATMGDDPHLVLQIWHKQRRAWDQVFKNEGDLHNLHSYSILHGLFAWLAADAAFGVKDHAIHRQFGLGDRIAARFRELLGSRRSIAHYFNREDEGIYFLSATGLDRWQAFLDKL